MTMQYSLVCSYKVLKSSHSFNRIFYQLAPFKQFEHVNRILSSAIFSIPHSVTLIAYAYDSAAFYRSAHSKFAHEARSLRDCSFCKLQSVSVPNKASRGSKQDDACIETSITAVNSVD